MIIDTQSFKTAQENMAYDTRHFIENPGYPYVRLYTWTHPGLTYPEKRKAVQTYGLDHASRSTGGGMVFHNPGDVLLTLKIPQDIVQEKGGMKAALAWVSQYNKHALQPLIHFDDIVQDAEVNIDFCNAYHNPFEGMVAHQKVMGIAARHFKKHLAVQCVFHLDGHHRHFPPQPSWIPYYSKGLEGRFGDLVIKNRLNDAWENWLTRL